MRRAQAASRAATESQQAVLAAHFILATSRRSIAQPAVHAVTAQLRVLNEDLHQYIRLSDFKRTLKKGLKGIQTCDC